MMVQKMLISEIIYPDLRLKTLKTTPVQFSYAVKAK